MGDELLILSCKEDHAREFEMKGLGLLNYFLGLEIWQRSDGLFVFQGKYAREILEKFNIRYHHIRDCVQRRIMLLSYIPTEDEDANILMKVLTRRKFEYHRGRIWVLDNPYLVEREC